MWVHFDSVFSIRAMSIHYHRLSVLLLFCSFSRYLYFKVKALKNIHFDLVIFCYLLIFINDITKKICRYFSSVAHRLFSYIFRMLLSYCECTLQFVIYMLSWLFFETSPKNVFVFIGRIRIAICKVRFKKKMRILNENISRSQVSWNGRYLTA